MDRLADLGLEPSHIALGLDILKKRGTVVDFGDGRYQLARIAASEQSIADNIRRLQAGTPRAFNIPQDAWEGRTPHALQAEALAAVSAHPVMVLTGGPGCIDASTLLLIQTGNRKCGRVYTVEDAFHKFHRIWRDGAAKGRNRFWQGEAQTLSMADDGGVGYNVIENIVFSGVKVVFDVRSRGGRQLLVSAEHPFKVPAGTPDADEDGYKLLSSLRVGDKVICRRTEASAPTKTGRDKTHRHEVHVPAHPTARSKFVTVSSGTYEYKLVREYRLIVEAQLNGLGLDDFVSRLQGAVPSPELKFLPHDLDVHHRNENPTDNAPTNLLALTKAEHAREHGFENRKHFGTQCTEEDEIVSITRVGERPVYDLQMRAPNHNYVVGGFVVHNCGKSAWTRALLNAAVSNGLRYVCCALAGKAARRMTELTGRPAGTIHRTLGFNPRKGFTFNASNPLPVDLVVIDEASMADAWIASSLFAAVATGARLVIIGDVDQLPAIGAGHVLHDLLASGALPAYRLTHIFRQASDSRIPWVAKDINEGRVPDLTPKGTDVSFLSAAHSGYCTAGRDGAGTCQTCEQAKGYVVGFMQHAIKQQRGISPRDTQVLAAQKTGPLGTEALNIALQRALNPTDNNEGDVFIGGGFSARAGDRVIHTRNDYNLGVFNGMVGGVVWSAPRGIPALEVEHLVRFGDDPWAVIANGIAEAAAAFAESLEVLVGATALMFQDGEFPPEMAESADQHMLATVDVALNDGTVGEGFWTPANPLEAIEAPVADGARGAGNVKPTVLVVDYGDKRVAYNASQARDLLLAYAITVHKAQGSQADAIIFVAPESHGFMLVRSLLYTAITRASRFCLLIGAESALGKAVRNRRGSERRTTLQERLASTPIPAAGSSLAGLADGFEDELDEDDGTNDAEDDGDDEVAVVAPPATRRFPAPVFDDDIPF